MATVLTDNGKREGAYIVSEDQSATNMRSRDRGTLLTGTVGLSGMVLGQVTASKKYKPFTTGASDGSQNPAAILFTSADASAADKPVVIHTRDCEVSDHELVWPAGISAGDKATAITALATKGIIVRTK